MAKKTGMGSKEPTKRKLASRSKLSKRSFSALIILLIVLVSLVIITKSSWPEKWFAPAHASKAQLVNIPKISTPSAILSSPSPTPKPSPQTRMTQINYGHTVHIPILYYHYIGNNPNPADKARDSLSITPDRFNEEMKYLSENNYHTMTYPEVYAAIKKQTGVPTKPVMLSFDDGYIDFYINAFPILQQYHIKSVAFIPTGKIDTGFYLHWDWIKQMDQSGLVDFEAHSIDHVNLAALSNENLKKQLVESKNKLESELGHPVNFMAYPYGTSDARVWKAVKEAGYLSAVGTWGSSTLSEGQIYDLPRLRMGGAVSLQDFLKKIQ